MQVFLAHDVGWFLVAWTLFTVILWVGALRIHGAMAWTFTLLPGLKFSDGQALTTADVIASLQRWSARDNIGQAITRAGGKWEAVDASTFKLTLDQPFDLVLEGLAKVSSYPAFIAQVGALAMGSSTYEWMLRNADAVRAETGSAWPTRSPPGFSPRAACRASTGRTSASCRATCGRCTRPCAWRRGRRTSG